MLGITSPTNESSFVSSGLWPSHDFGPQSEDFASFSCLPQTDNWPPALAEDLTNDRVDNIPRLFNAVLDEPTHNAVDTNASWQGFMVQFLQE
jgi:hypothetical protein